MNSNINIARKIIEQWKLKGEYVGNNSPAVICKECNYTLFNKGTNCPSCGSTNVLNVTAICGLTKRIKKYGTD